jgi:hypothetical protein
MPQPYRPPKCAKCGAALGEFDYCTTCDVEPVPVYTRVQCSTCAGVLTPEEIEFYGNTRNACEAAAHGEDVFTFWRRPDIELPPDEMPVLIVVKGKRRIGARFWDHPGFEDTYKSFWYWDDPDDDGQCWENSDVTLWTFLPEMPT